MLLPEVPSDIYYTAEKSHLFLSLLEFPIPPPNPQRASDVSVHAIPSLIKEGTMGQPRSQTPLTTKYQHTLFASNTRAGKSTPENHTALLCTTTSFSPYSQPSQEPRHCWSRRLDATKLLVNRTRYNGHTLTTILKPVPGHAPASP